MNKNISILENYAKEMNIYLSKRQLCQFSDYFDLLIDWNERINLTAITEWEDVVIKHFLDSMSLLNAFDSFDVFYESMKNKSLADIGTGAGFPGIPLKILIPELKVTLMDSLEKRINFLNTVISSLELKDINSVHGRVEDLAHDNLFREKYDYSTARAVASLPVLCEYCLPFVKKEGCFYAYKSEKANEEILASSNSISLLGGEIRKINNFIIPHSDANRTIIEIKKVECTPIKYPRKAGTPSKKPL